MSQQDQIQSLAVLRPRFKVLSPRSIPELVASIKQELKNKNSDCIGECTEHYTAISIRKDWQHYWSPMLNMTMEVDEKGTLLRGQYGPRPAIWTMFVFFYSTIGFSIVFIAMMGFSQVSLDKPANILWLIPVLAAIFLTFYLVAYYGKKKSRKQMDILHRFVEVCLNDTFEEEV